MRSTWNSGSLRLGKYPELGVSKNADVVVVGAGLTGALSAYMLAQAGKRVVLLEAGAQGNNATSSYTTAFITQALDTPLTELVSLFGARKTRRIWRAGEGAIQQLETIIRKEDIDCDFMRCPGFAYARSQQDQQALEEEARTAERLGLDVSLGADALGIHHAGYLEIPNQAKFHPLKFLAGVLQRASDRKAEIYENSRVERVDFSGPLFTVRTRRASVTSKDLIIATHKPFDAKGTRFKKGTYISYVLELRLPAGSIKEGLYWDSANPYHYLRTDRMKGYDRVIFGGEDHRAEIKMKPARSFAALQQHFDELVWPAQYKIVRRWTGPILESVDGVALIGKVADHLYVATGFSGNGMVYAALAARLFTDAITGRRNEWQSIYSPRRHFPTRRLFLKGKDYIGEFFGGAVKNLL